MTVPPVSKPLLSPKVHWYTAIGGIAVTFIGWLLQPQVLAVMPQKVSMVVQAVGVVALAVGGVNLGHHIAQGASS